MNTHTECSTFATIYMETCHRKLCLVMRLLPVKRLKVFANVESHFIFKQDIFPKDD